MGFRSYFLGNTGVTYYEVYLRESDNFWWDYTASSGAGAWAANPSAANRRKAFTEIDPTNSPGMFWCNQTQNLSSSAIDITRLVWDSSISEHVLADQWRIVDNIRIPRIWHPNYDEIETGIRFLKAFREMAARLRGKSVISGTRKKKFRAFDGLTDLIEMEFDAVDAGVRTPTSLT